VKNPVKLKLCPVKPVKGKTAPCRARPKAKVTPKARGGHALPVR
jgi:hypothetical protein